MRYRLAAIICAACCRLVSVTLAPLNMRATSWVRARSSRTRICVLRAAVILALFYGQMLIGEGGDLRQMRDTQEPAARGRAP